MSSVSLEFPVGARSRDARCINVTILEDFLKEPAEIFIVSMTVNLTGGDHNIGNFITEVNITDGKHNILLWLSIKVVTFFIN